MFDGRRVATSLESCCCFGERMGGQAEERAGAVTAISDWFWEGGRGRESREKIKRGSRRRFTSYHRFRPAGRARRTRYALRTSHRTTSAKQPPFLTHPRLTPVPLFASSNCASPAASSPLEARLGRPVTSSEPELHPARLSAPNPPATRSQYPHPPPQHPSRYEAWPVATPKRSGGSQSVTLEKSITRLVTRVCFFRVFSVVFLYWSLTSPSSRAPDDEWEYRHVIVPKALVKYLPKDRLAEEDEWRGLGIRQSPGWVRLCFLASQRTFTFLSVILTVAWTGSGRFTSFVTPPSRTSSFSSGRRITTSSSFAILSADFNLPDSDSTDAQHL
jgi:hypothetical protein